MNRTNFEKELVERVNALADNAPTEPTRQPESVASDPPGHGHRRQLSLAAAFVLLIAFTAIWTVAKREPNTEIVTSPNIQTTTTTREAPTTSAEPAAQPPPTTSDLAAGIAIVGLTESIDLKVLSVRPNNVSLAVTDLFARTTKIYPPGSTEVGPDAASGAAITPRGDIAVWVLDTVYVFVGGDLAVEPVELSPSRVDPIPGVANELFVQASADGEHMWIVQPGLCCEDDTSFTIIDRVRTNTGEIVTTVEITEEGIPVGETDAGLIVNLTGDITDPATESIAVVVFDGTISNLGPGRAIATWRNYVALYRQGRDELLILNLDDNSVQPVTIDEPGNWSDVGGPTIPSTAQPLPTVSGDGRLLIGRTGPERDGNGGATNSALYMVDFETRQVTRLIEFSGYAPLATWSNQDEWILLLRGPDLELFNLIDNRSISLPNAIPDEHFVLGAG